MYLLFIFTSLVVCIPDLLGAHKGSASLDTAPAHHHGLSRRYKGEVVDHGALSKRSKRLRTPLAAVLRRSASSESGAEDAAECFNARCDPDTEYCDTGSERCLSCRNLCRTGSSTTQRVQHRASICEALCPRYLDKQRAEQHEKRQLEWKINFSASSCSEESQSSGPVIVVLAMLLAGSVLGHVLSSFFFLRPALRSFLRCGLPWCCCRRRLNRRTSQGMTKPETDYTALAVALRSTGAIQLYTAGKPDMLQQPYVSEEYDPALGVPSPSTSIAPHDQVHRSLATSRITSVNGSSDSIHRTARIDYISVATRHTVSIGNNSVVACTASVDDSDVAIRRRSGVDNNNVATCRTSNVDNSNVFTRPTTVVGHNSLDTPHATIVDADNISTYRSTRLDGSNETSSGVLHTFRSDDRVDARNNTIIEQATT